MRAAVLIPLYEDGGELRLILTRRGGGMATHPGDVVFPGGMIEPGDGGPEEAARREAWEEIGLPPESIEVLGGLEPTTARSTEILIVPVVARVTRPERKRKGGTSVRFDRNNVCFAPERNHDPRQESAASDSDHPVCDVGSLLDHFQTQGALTGDGRNLVVGMDERTACRGQEFVGVGECFARRIAVLNHRRVESAHRVHLGAGGRAGDDNGRPAPEFVCHPGHGQTVVASGARDHVIGVQQHQRVGGTPRLERAGDLKRLELQRDLLRAGRGRHDNVQTRRVAQQGLDAGGGSCDVCIRDRRILPLQIRRHHLSIVAG
jgi:8-oxo-dGTP pyrophosphatase MutT (NUDIX family)